MNWLAMNLASHCPLLLMLALGAAAPAQAAGSDDGERARLASERAAIESRTAERERECRQRFVVMSCIEDARRDRRRGLDDLRARQLQLDEARRVARTAERRAELAAKAAEDAKRERERAARAASAPAARREPQPLEPRHEGAAASAANGGRRSGDHPGALGAGLGAPVRAETAAQRHEREERYRMSFETRKRQAAEHRQQVEEKAAKRLMERPPAAPLPEPPR